MSASCMCCVRECMCERLCMCCVRECMCERPCMCCECVCVCVCVCVCASVYLCMDHHGNWCRCAQYMYIYIHTVQQYMIYIHTYIRSTCVRDAPFSKFESGIWNTFSTLLSDSSFYVFAYTCVYINTRRNKVPAFLFLFFLYEVVSRNLKPNPRSS